MIGIAYRLIERLAFVASAAILFAALSSCSGAVGGNPPANACGEALCKLTILPGDGTVMYSGQPTTFTISGGTGQYIVASSNQSVLPTIGAAQNATSITLIPSAVSADTPVTISVRDTGTAPVASATVTVKPGTINNEILITPSSTQATGCPTGTLCSGGDALVSVTLSQAGLALANRQVRFDAVSGDFRFITSPSGSTPETLSTTALVTTDASGRASIRIRANADAPNQTAIVQATDVATGAFRQAAFAIAQTTGASPGFFASPSSYTFTGPVPGQCASVNVTAGIGATFFIFGGTPPYTILNSSSGLSLTRDTVFTSGGSFDVRPTGACLTNVPITIRDASGHTTTVTVSNVEGATPTSPLVVSPSTVSLSSCSSVATVTAGGGTGRYVASTGSGGVYVIPFLGTNQFQIGRYSGSGPLTSPQTVGVTDGVTSQTVTVNLTGQGLGPCPAPAFTVTPGNVTLTSCTGTASVTVSGGSGVYSFGTNSSALNVTLSGNTLTIGRNKGPQATPNPATVTVSDGVNTNQQVNVTDSAGICP